MSACGLVILNTLREIEPRLKRVGDAMPTLVSAGGVSLFLDALFPLPVNPDFAAKARPNFLKGDYAPLDPTHGHPLPQEVSEKLAESLAKFGAEIEAMTT